MKIFFVLQATKELTLEIWQGSRKLIPSIFNLFFLGHDIFFVSCHIINYLLTIIANNLLISFWGILALGCLCGDLTARPWVNNLTLMLIIIFFSFTIVVKLLFRFGLTVNFCY